MWVFRNISFAAVLALASCTAGSAPPAGLTVTRIGATGFSLSPDRCEASFLFDDFELARPAPQAGATVDAPSAERTIHLTVPADADSANVTIAVRGALNAVDGAAGTLRVEYGANAQDYPLTVAGEADGTFLHEFTTTAPAGSSTLRITASVAADPANEALLSVDSADVSLTGTPGCVAAGQ